MFKNPFSFSGRIRRTEYGITFIIYLIINTIITLVAESGDGAGIFYLAYIPTLWFLWAQGAKRCHDLGHNGWWQIIPFYFFWLIFQDGNNESNEYGVSPKRGGTQEEKTNSTTTEAVKFCHQCGQKIDFDSKFCVKCGEKLD